LAVHSLVFHRPTLDAIGTARLILARHAGGGLPIQRILGEHGFNAEDYFPTATTAEVSGVAISNQFRRCRPEKSSAADDRRESETCGVLPFLGLLQDLLRQSVALGVTHWGAVMEPKMLRMQAMLGVHSMPVGPLVSYRGLRQPSYCHIPSMLERLYRERPANWMVITDGGALVRRN